MSKKRLVVVDISSFIFRAFYAIRSMTSPDGTPTNAVRGVLSMLLKLLSTHRPSHVIIARDTKGGSFRNEMYEEYKANRSEPPDDLKPQFALVKELIDKMGMTQVTLENYEADDIIGSVCEQWRNEFDEIYIVSGDKDLMQFVHGSVFMLDTMKDKIYDAEGVFEKMGVHPNQIVDYLSMVGDTSDNIPGMKGIGAKGAAKLLAEYGTLDGCVENKDKLKGKKVIEAFSDYLEDGMISRDLIRIKADLELGVDPEATDYRFEANQELFEFLEKLGFKTVLKQIRDPPVAESKLSNNIIFRKLKIALNYQSGDILECLKLADYRLSEHELSAFFRKPEHKHYRKCMDQVLRNFLAGVQHRFNNEKP